MGTIEQFNKYVMHSYGRYDLVMDKGEGRCAEDEIKILIDIHEGDHSAIAWGCDLTFDYVKINAEYRT